MRVLIVDDQPSITTLLLRCFGEEYIVDCYNTVEEASDRIEYITYDIFCLDIHLSEKDAEGIDLCRKARFINPSSVIIMFTGSEVDGSMIARMMEAGANTFIEKKNITSHIVHKAIELVEAQHRKAKEALRQHHNNDLYAKIIIDEDHNILTIDDVITPIGRTPLKILNYLYERPNKYLHSSEIALAVKDMDSQTGISVKAHIMTIRKILGLYEHHIQNAWGGWYGFFLENTQDNGK